VKRTILSEVFLLENFVEENEASHIFTRNKIFRAEKNLSWVERSYEVASGTNHLKCVRRVSLRSERTSERSERDISIFRVFILPVHFEEMFRMALRIILRYTFCFAVRIHRIMRKEES